MVLLIIVSVSVHQRPNLASGISLYVSFDREVAMCVPPRCADFPDQEAQRVKAASSKQQALDSWDRII